MSNEFCSYLAVFGFAVLIAAAVWGIWSLVRLGFRHLMNTYKIHDGPEFRAQIDARISAQGQLAQTQLDALRKELTETVRRLTYTQAHVDQLDLDLKILGGTKMVPKKLSPSK